MHWERIENIVGNRRGVRFPILPCQEQFFGMFNQAPQLITYDELMHETFEDMAHPFHQYFEDVENRWKNLAPGIKEYGGIIEVLKY